MVSGDTKFSHITVNADDDDDFVIQAGARPSGSGRGAGASVEMHAPEAIPEPAGEVELESEVVRSDEGVDKAHSAEVSAARAARADDRYHEITAEDLEVEPMSGMQKAIIAIAAALILVAVAYCIFFMR